MRLQAKINALYIGLTLILFVASFVGIYFIYQWMAYNTEFEQLQAQSDELLLTMSDIKQDAHVEATFRNFVPPNGLIHVVANDGQSLFRIQATSSVDKLTYSFDEDARYTISTSNGQRIIATSSPIIFPSGETATVHFVQPLTTLNSQLVALRWILLFILIVAIVPIYFASQAIVRITAKPIERLTETVRKNTTSNRYDEHTTSSRSKDEIAELTASYNKLMQTLSASYSKQQHFVGNASHELKTPLTIIESYANLLQRRGFSNSAVNDEALQAITSQTKQMHAMIEQMLQLASADEHLSINWQQVDVQQICENVATSFMQAYRRNIHVTGNRPIIMSDAEKLTQILFILFDNARKYSETDIFVHVSGDEIVRISVEDNGIGIPQDELSSIFERFYRVAKDRSRTTGGTGLGLAIAKSFVQSINGYLEVTSTVNVGSTFTLIVRKDGRR